jgi:hypothetical protein
MNSYKAGILFAHVCVMVYLTTAPPRTVMFLITPYKRGTG